MLLEVEDLKVEFPTLRGVVHALQGVSFHLARRETLGLAGETGCGKSVTALSVLKLIASPPGRVSGKAILFEGDDLLRKGDSEMRKIRGAGISMIFQEPMTSLDPSFSVGSQMVEVLAAHRGLTAEARTQAFAGRAAQVEAMPPRVEAVIDPLELAFEDGV